MTDVDPALVLGGVRLRNLIFAEAWRRHCGYPEEIPLKDRAYRLWERGGIDFGAYQEVAALPPQATADEETETEAEHA
ncbi:MAG: hypothetical protein UY48_C0002G0031 [Candidatus Gottesmanbacteria bacterium GW2011_GWB1_49_7]|uniref:Uncharacterized protein n=1 Tax=Candidatus Gottesmanbacteria bacterium GW2011_GWB1_49_7 TaxID=1618448 RepID=A0A0G1W431_9BACT|nr:MAG: hypothetical protein UY48_C0002G0031 [Candidatus Gottesmanbacteria bacterium GW2011_GWB1_49_7]